MHFFQSKSTKYEIFTWNFDFSGNAYCRDSKPVPLDSACLKALNPPLKPFQCIFPSQNQQNVKFLAICLTPPDKKWKICQFVQGKCVWKGLKICTYRFLGMPITVHYVRTLCEKYFVELWWFWQEGLCIEFWNIV